MTNEHNLMQYHGKFNISLSNNNFILKILRQKAYPKKFQRNPYFPSQIVLWNFISLENSNIS